MKHMKRLFLTSSANKVAGDIAGKFEGPIKGQKLAYINTAAEIDDTDPHGLKLDRSALQGLGFEVFDYTLTGKNASQLRTDLQGADVLYVCGGNVFYLLYQIQQSGFAAIAREHVEAGKVYIGTSAGSIVAGPDVSVAHRVDALEKAPQLTSFEGMGLVDFTVFPHWGSVQARDLYLKHRMEHAYDTAHKLILLNDLQYVEVVGDWYRICAS